MAETVWNTRPAYTPAQVQARFGAGARLVRRGDGRWTIAGAAAPVPVPGAPIDPSTGKPYLPTNRGTGYGPGTRPGPGTPATAAGPAGAAPASAPPPLPVSLGAQAGIDSVTDQLGALPGIFNPRRLSLYTEGGRGLTDEGYFDTAQVDVAAQTPDGSTSYRIVAGPDGQLYREATNGINAAANSRGMLFSSATRESQASRARALTNARDSILRRLSSSQDSITGDQTQQAATLRGDLNTRQGEYADWRASQPVPPPPPQSVAAVAAARAPAGPPGPNNPRNPGTLVLPNPPAPPKVRHRRSGVRR